MADIPKKRIGNTLIIRWQVTTSGLNVPFDGRDLTLRIVDPMGNGTILPFAFDEGTNIAQFIFQGKNQRIKGQYTIEMWENKAKDMQAVVDRTEVFELVAHTKDEEGG